MKTFKKHFLILLWTIVILIVIILVFVGIFVIKNYNKSKNEQNSTPVEEIRIVDSIIRENNNTKVIIEKINEDKNETVNKVHNLDNDSTLKLFYMLVKEQ